MLDTTKLRPHRPHLGVQRTTARTWICMSQSAFHCPWARHSPLGWSLGAAYSKYVFSMAQMEKVNFLTGTNKIWSKFLWMQSLINHSLIKNHHQKMFGNCREALCCSLKISIRHRPFSQQKKQNTFLISNPLNLNEIEWPKSLFLLWSM